MRRGIHVCSFTQGHYRIAKPGGSRVIVFEDSDQFGPSAFDARRGDVEPINDRNRWFWDWYKKWRDAGRPCDPGEQSTPCGVTILSARWM